MDGVRGRAVIGVVGGSGGVGASSFAAALTLTGPPGRVPMLVDLDVDGGGIDVPLGVEDAPRARWSGLRLAGGDLDPGALRSGLCRWADRAVLAADVGVLSVDAVAQVLDVAVRGGPVVLDLPRRDCAERTVALQRCDLVAMVVRGDVAGLVSAHAVADRLRDGPALGVLVRRGDVAPGEAARLVGADLLGALPGTRRHDPAHPSRQSCGLAVGVWTGVSARGPTARHAIPPLGLGAR